MGADDYIAKPYSIKNVLARVRSILRRTGTATAETEDDGTCLAYGNLFMNQNKKQCIFDGRDHEHRLALHQEQKKIRIKK